VVGRVTFVPFLIVIMFLAGFILSMYVDSQTSAGDDVDRTMTTAVQSEGNGETSEEVSECSITGLRATIFSHNDSVLLKFYSTCETEFEVYLGDTYVGKVNVTRGENIITLVAPIDIRYGQVFDVIVKHGEYTYVYPDVIAKVGESLKILPYSYVDATNGTLVLVIQNVGYAPAYIYKVELNGVELDLTKASSPDAGNGVTIDTTNGKIIIQPGVKTTIYIPVGDNVNLAAGVQYSVTIYTEAGNVYTTVVYGK